MQPRTTRDTAVKASLSSQIRMEKARGGSSHIHNVQGDGVRLEVRHWNPWLELTLETAHHSPTYTKRSGRAGVMARVKGARGRATLCLRPLPTDRTVPYPAYRCAVLCCAVLGWVLCRARRGVVEGSTPSRVMEIFMYVFLALQNMVRLVPRKQPRLRLSTEIR
jgi:hypothetical protein